MVRDERHLLYVGIKNSLVALDTRDGSERWRSKLGGFGYINVYWDGEELFAAAKGEVFRLDPRTGEVVWQNEMTGLGTGAVIFASTRAATAGGGQVSAAEQARQAAQRNANAAT
jgi:outer membrane protein assembly factor BamB